MEHKKKIAGYHSIIKQQSALIEKPALQHFQSSLNQYKKQSLCDEEPQDSPNYKHQETVQTMYEKDLDSSSNDIDKLGEQFAQSSSHSFLNNISRLINHLHQDGTDEYIDSFSSTPLQTEKELTAKLTRLRNYNISLLEKIEALSHHHEDKYMLSDSNMKIAKELDNHYDKLKKKNSLYKKQLLFLKNSNSNDYYKKRIEHILENLLLEYKEIIREVKENSKSRQSYTEKSKENIVNSANDNENNFDSRCDFEECWSITNQSNLSNHSIDKDGEISHNAPHTGNSHSNLNSNCNVNNANANTNKRIDQGQALIKSTRINGGIVGKDLLNSNIHLNKNNPASSSHPFLMKSNMPSFANKPNTNRLKYSKK